MIDYYQMQIGRRNSEDAMQYDVIIVGSGIAGHSLAIDLAHTGKSIAMLEAGPKKHSASSQRFYQGEIAKTSLPHLPIDQWRIRALGGTSNFWGGAVVPFDKHDFSTTDVNGRRLWPITYDELLPFYDRVQKRLGLNIPQSTEEIYRANVHSVFSDQSQLPSFDSKILIRKNGRSIDFSDYERPSNVSVLVNHQVIDFEIANGRITAVFAYDDIEKKIKRFFAKNIVLAAGGLETTRIFLSSAVVSHIPQPDLVGRFYSPHINQPLGLVIKTTAKSDLMVDYKAYNASSAYRAFLSPKEALINDGGINVKIMFDRAILESWKAFNVLAGLWKKNIFKAVLRNDILQVWFISDQAPNPNSTVRLGKKIGPDRLPQLLINHQCLEEDFLRIDRVAQVLSAEFAEKGWRYYPKYVRKNTARFAAASHHTGTLRMADTSRHGLVDKNLRVFGIENFFVCSSAVFPTAGHANPTFTIAALASRLATHMQEAQLL